MRQFKFRAWDKENEVMIYPKGILFDGRVVNFSCGILEPFERCELMQYTGLKDKNGKEIYEGDIYDTGSRKFVVKYEEERAGYFPFAKDDGCGCCSDELVTYPYMGEVIGNIYEDKHLLKEESK